MTSKCDIAAILYTSVRIGAVFCALTCSFAVMAEPRVENLSANAASCSLVELNGSFQLVLVVGPAADPIAPELVDKDKATYVMLRAVPDALEVIGDLVAEVPVRGVILHGCGLDDAGLASIAERCPQIKTLSLRSPLTLSRAEIADFTVAQRAQLFSLRPSPSGMEHLKRFRELYTLELAGYQLPPSRLEMLSAMPELTTLEFAACDLRDSDVVDLARVPQLENLTLAGTCVTVDGLMPLRGCKQLAYLNLDGSQVGDDLASLFAGRELRHLRRVSVSGSKITDNGIRELSKTIPFVEVNDEDQVVHNVMPTAFEDPERLRRHRAAAFIALFGGARMSIRDRRVEMLILPAGFDAPTETMLQQVAFLSDVRTLGLAGRRVSEMGLQFVAEMSKLEEIDLAESTLADAALREIAKVKSLKVLSLAGTGVTDLGVRQLQQISSLEELSLKNTSVTDASLEVIANLPNLRKLDLENCPITDKGLDHLLNMDSLETIDVQGTNLSLEAQIRIHEHVAR